MRNASIHRPAGHWPKESAAGTLTLDFDARHRRRIRLTADHGEDILLDLPKAVAMADGDGLQLEDGRWLKVQAAAELIVEIRHINSCGSHGILETGTCRLKFETTLFVFGPTT
jgi:urease accessory protein